MRLETKLPKEYESEEFSLPIFSNGNAVTKRVRNGLENVLYLYANLGRKLAIDNENNPYNLRVKDIFVVGSGARKNRIDSDLDFLLIAPEIDDSIANSLKTILSYVLFCDKNKQEAIDVFIRPYDKYPERSSIKITSQVGDLLNKYNRILEK